MISAEASPKTACDFCTVDSSWTKVPFNPSNPPTNLPFAPLALSKAFSVFTVTVSVPLRVAFKFVNSLFATMIEFALAPMALPLPTLPSALAELPAKGLNCFVSVVLNSS
jgi:hypothetical protein